MSKSDPSLKRKDRVAKSLVVGKTWLLEAKIVKDLGKKDLIEHMNNGDISVQAYKFIMKKKELAKLY